MHTFKSISLLRGTVLLLWSCNTTTNQSAETDDQTSAATSQPEKGADWSQLPYFHAIHSPLHTKTTVSFDVHWPGRVSRDADSADFWVIKHDQVFRDIAEYHKVHYANTVELIQNGNYLDLREIRKTPDSLLVRMPVDASQIEDKAQRVVVRCTFWNEYPTGHDSSFQAGYLQVPFVGVNDAKNGR